jgi:hypothetical protein
VRGAVWVPVLKLSGFDERQRSALSASDDDAR